MQGNKRVTKSLDIVKLLKDIRYLKLLASMHIKPDTETKFRIYHSDKNVIKIDKEVDKKDEQTFIVYRYRTNVSKANIMGVEAVVEMDWCKILFSDTTKKIEIDLTYVAVVQIDIYFFKMSI